MANVDQLTSYREMAVRYDVVPEETAAETIKKLFRKAPDKHAIRRWVQVVHNTLRFPSPDAGIVPPEKHHADELRAYIAFLKQLKKTYDEASPEEKKELALDARCDLPLQRTVKDDDRAPPRQAFKKPSAPSVEASQASIENAYDRRENQETQDEARTER